MKSYNNNNNNRYVKFSDRWSVIVAALAGVITGAFLMSALTYAGRSDWPSHLLAAGKSASVTTVADTAVQLNAIVHYATSKVVPQQSLAEITQSLNVLKSLSPCNFLVFGLGHDSIMWAALNPNGPTLFLEEDPKWVKAVLSKAPFLNAKTVSYRTQLKEADELLKSYKAEPDCHPSRTFLKGNGKCRLALENLPEEVYAKEWDVIMIDAPKGYFPKAPGRMAAIFSAAVMARARTRMGVTHVFLHDVDRTVEKQFAEEFLCMKYKVGGAGKLWHFAIPPVRQNDHNNDKFC
uniref:Glucuronoxylan 4-O-methyltransferase n=1 Tax=Opuntia streptacantha TaxID=393608 RepID=A0A7C9DRR3_OPUST